MRVCFPSRGVHTELRSFNGFTVRLLCVRQLSDSCFHSGAGGCQTRASTRTTDGEAAGEEKDGTWGARTYRGIPAEATSCVSSRVNTQTENREE